MIPSASGWLVRDRCALLSLPQAPYDAGKKQAARSNSLSAVRYRGNDYSCRLPIATARYW